MAAGTVQAYEVKGAGLKQVNGIYVRHGDYRGSPRYKQLNSSNPFYIRQGGSTNIGFGISGTNTEPEATWLYFCEKSRNKKGLQLVPRDSWVCHGGLKAVAPGPTVVPTEAPEKSLIEVIQQKVSSHNMAFLLISEAGKANGIYMYEDEFRGGPRYSRMQSVDKAEEAWLRVGTKGFWVIEGKREGYRGTAHMFYGRYTGDTAVPLGRWPDDVGPLGVAPMPTVNVLEIMKMRNESQLEYFGEVFTDNSNQERPRLKELAEENEELKKSVEEYKKLIQLYEMNRERLKDENCLAIFIGNSNYNKIFARVSIVKREMELIKSIFGNATNWTFEQHIDVTLDQYNSLMEVELPKLCKKLKPKVILFYYLGHGVQIDNEDYFVSLDERLIKVDWIRNNVTVQESNAIVICNCCREKLTDEEEQQLVETVETYENLGFKMKEIPKGGLHTCFVVDKRLKEYYKLGKPTRFATTFDEIMQERLKQGDAFNLVDVLMECNTSLQSLQCTFKECDKLEPGEYRIHGGIVAPFFTKNQTSV